MDLIFESLIDLSDTVETLNCNPQSLPSATDEPLKWTIGVLFFLASDSILSEMFFLTDSEKTTKFEFFKEPKTCFEPNVHFFL